ncbi:hypothetical protein KXX41_006437, partial [Aspergillus fumigatus]
YQYARRPMAIITLKGIIEGPLAGPNVMMAYPLPKARSALTPSMTHFPHTPYLYPSIKLLPLYSLIVDDSLRSSTKHFAMPHLALRARYRLRL